MNDIPIINYLPAKYRGWAIVLVLAFPYLTRAYHALTTSGGLRGAWESIWFGTNTPPSVASDIKNIGTAINQINQMGPNPDAVLTVNGQTKKT